MHRLFRQHSLFFCNDTATTEIYTLSLHDALPICRRTGSARPAHCPVRPDPAAISWQSFLPGPGRGVGCPARRTPRSEEHTSELQSRQYLVCRLLLEKKHISLLTTLLSPMRRAVLR